MEGVGESACTKVDLGKSPGVSKGPGRTEIKPKCREVSERKLFRAGLGRLLDLGFHEGLNRAEMTCSRKFGKESARI